MRLFSFDSISKVKYMPDWCTLQKKETVFTKLNIRLTTYKEELQRARVIQPSLREIKWETKACKQEPAGLGRWGAGVAQGAWRQQGHTQPSHPASALHVPTPHTSAPQERRGLRKWS